MRIVVTHDQIKPDRRRLDQIVLGDILGLDDGEQADVYRSVIDLVCARIERARRLNHNSRTRNGIDRSAFCRFGLTKDVNSQPQPYLNLRFAYLRLAPACASRELQP
jgi:hypothetical protein